MAAIIRAMRIVIIASIFLGFMACTTPTTFTGAAKIPNGPSGCQAMCTEWNMDMAGMVAMGEYSTACICMIPGKAQSAAVVGSLGPAVVGVIEQMRSQQDRDAQGYSASTSSAGAAGR